VWTAAVLSDSLLVASAWSIRIILGTSLPLGAPGARCAEIKYRKLSPLAISELGLALGTLSQAKTWGGLGSMLTLLTVVPLFGAIVGSMGFILIIMAMKEIADAMHDKTIYINTLIGATTSIGGLILTSLVVVRSMVRFVGLKNVTGLLPFGPSLNLQPFAVGDPVGLFFAILPGLFIIWIVQLTAAVFLRRAYESIAARPKFKTLKTAGWLYLAGSSTTIILVGFGLLLVGQVILSRAFFSMEEEVPSLSVPQVRPPQASPPAA
jgi:uncharacterized membrane protein